MLLELVILTAYCSLWSHHDVAVASAMLTLSRDRDISTVHRHPWRKIPCSSICHRPTSFSSTHLPAAAAAAAAAAAHDNGGNHNNADSGSSASSILPARCSSRDAASIIRNCSAADGLLIITCDASGRGVRTHFNFFRTIFFLSIFLHHISHAIVSLGGIQT